MGSQGGLKPPPVLVTTSRSSVLDDGNPSLSLTREVWRRILGLSFRHTEPRLPSPVVNVSLRERRVRANPSD